MKVKNSGFTLLEVMIAVTVFAVVAATLSKTTSQSVGNILYLEEKTLAGFVAENAMNKIRLSGKVPDIGSSNDVVDMAQREWRVNTKVEATRFPKVVKISVSVAKAEEKDYNLATLNTILAPY